LTNWQLAATANNRHFSQDTETQVING